MDWHNQQDLAKYRRRKRLKEAKTPERDDIAAELMRAYLDIVAVDHGKVAELSRALFNGLQERGYNRNASVERVKAMARRVQAKLRDQGAAAAAE